MQLAGCPDDTIKPLDMSFGENIRCIGLWNDGGEASRLDTAFANLTVELEEVLFW